LVGSFLPTLWGQPVEASTSDTSTNGAAGNPEAQLAALRLELTNAWQRVVLIVNQPVQAYVQNSDVSVSIYRPGWFHAGAIRPDFDNVDVRKSQELTYTDQYVSSDLNPGIMFLGRDLEFNSMTKFFYVNRSLPKHKLSEAQMLEINRLYRIIGRCEKEIRRMQAPPEVVSSAADQVDSNAEPASAPTGALARIQSIPRQTRLVYGGIAIGVLIVLAIGLRLLRKNSD
jgi:hypothetical protein